VWLWLVEGSEDIHRVEAPSDLRAIWIRRERRNVDTIHIRWWGDSNKE
jgi:hypothetical protein